MVHCIVVGCGSKSGKHKINFSKIPKIVTNQGKEWEELTRERRNRWISAVSRGDTEAKNVLESECVCGRHFVSGKPAPSWDKHNIYWVPTLNLGKKEYKESERKEQQQKAAGKELKEQKNAGSEALSNKKPKLPRKKSILNLSPLNRPKPASRKHATIPEPAKKASLFTASLPSPNKEYMLTKYFSIVIEILTNHIAVTAHNKGLPRKR